MAPTHWNPYASPLFRRSHHAAAPNGKYSAEIGEAREVSMSNPTSGELTTSVGLNLPNCNPAFIWSDDSRYLAVPQFVWRLGILRRQRVVVIDVATGSFLVSRATAFYFEPQVLEFGTLVLVRNPFGRAERESWQLNSPRYFRSTSTP
jgi:hypothetical protein